MQSAMQLPMQPAMQPPMQPASQQPMQDSFSNINLSLDSSMFQGSSTLDIFKLDTSRQLSKPHHTPLLTSSMMPMWWCKASQPVNHFGG